MSGPRVYTVEEADALVPVFDAAFQALDEVRARLRDAKIKLTALEMIWGSAVNDDSCPDHQEGLALLEQLKGLQESFNEVLQQLAARSVTVKDVDSGLLDLFHVRGGVLVHLCWKRGEAAFAAWHHVDAGFAQRQPL